MVAASSNVMMSHVNHIVHRWCVESQARVSTLISAEYCPPQYFRTGRHSSFINFAIFHLKCAGFEDGGGVGAMEEGCEILNDESFEKHVSQGDHDS